LVVVVLQAAQALQTQPMVSIVVLEQLLLQSVVVVVEIQPQVVHQMTVALAALVVAVLALGIAILVLTFQVQAEAVPLVKVLLVLVVLLMDLVVALQAVVVALAPHLLCMVLEATDLLTLALLMLVVVVVEMMLTTLLVVQVAVVKEAWLVHLVGLELQIAVAVVVVLVAYLEGLYLLVAQAVQVL
jgi:hypothetical protein